MTFFTLYQCICYYYYYILLYYFFHLNTFKWNLKFCFKVQQINREKGHNERADVCVPCSAFHLKQRDKKWQSSEKHGKRQSSKSRCKLHFDWLLISSEGCFVWFLFWVNELNQSHWSCGSKLSVLCFCLSGDQRGLYPHFINPEPGTILGKSRGIYHYPFTCKNLCVY